ncbi:hypothetical protein U1Q18_005652 [Sarracenia purpurea var. burkii]
MKFCVRCIERRWRARRSNQRSNDGVGGRRRCGERRLEVDDLVDLEGGDAGEGSAVRRRAEGFRSSGDREEASVVGRRRHRWWEGGGRDR